MNSMLEGNIVGIKKNCWNDNNNYKVILYLTSFMVNRFTVL